MAIDAPSLALARRFLDLHGPPGSVLLVSITGSHLYGFPSPDSDLDLKGIHEAPLSRAIGLFPGKESHDRLLVFDGIECDLTTNELCVSLRLLLKGNGNLLERIHSPLVVAEAAGIDELRALAHGSVSKNCIGHYRGFFHGCKREALRKTTAKALLYSIRVALTGAHLLRTGEVVCDIDDLLQTFAVPEAHDLLALKRASGEKVAPPQALADATVARWSALEAAMDDALAHSPLPHEPPNVDAIDDWFIRRRLALA